MAAVIFQEGCLCCPSHAKNQILCLPSLLFWYSVCIVDSQKWIKALLLSSTFRLWLHNIGNFININSFPRSVSKDTLLHAEDMKTFCENRVDFHLVLILLGEVTSLSMYFSLFPQPILPCMERTLGRRLFFLMFYKRK